MGLFSRKKIKDNEKKSEKKSVKTGSGKKEIKTEKKKEKTEKKQSMRELYGSRQPSPNKEEAQQSGEKTVAVGKGKKKYGNAYRVIVKPLVTEKAANLGSINKYVFEASASVNKIEIAKAIYEIYGIKPTGVNIINMQGKQTRQGRIKGKRKDWKKAIITLPAGKSIKIYEGV